MLFPDWRPGDEHVVVLSPHDDDALLGAGYLILAALANGAKVSAVIFCDGRAGYSAPAGREAGVEVQCGEREEGRRDERCAQAPDLDKAAGEDRSGHQ